MMDAAKAMFDWLRGCEYLQRSLYAIFGKETSDARIFIPQVDPRYVSKDILGNEKRYCTVSLINYAEMQEVPAARGITPDNIDAYIDIQAVINWINDQNRAGNLPDFGPGTYTDEVYALMANPELTGYNNTTRTARYALTVRAEYMKEAED